MIISMTGFGSAQVQNRDIELEITIKSLNGRFLEMRCHLPREYAAFEREAKKILSQGLARGTLDLYVNRRTLSSAAVNLHVNESAAKRYVKAHRDLAKKLGLPADPKMPDIMALPEILIWRSAQVSSSEKSLFLKGVTLALKAMLDECRREGKAIEKHLDTLLVTLIQQVQKMSALADQARVELGQKLKERLARSAASEKFEASRLNQELALYLDRADIGEEIQRLGEHLKKCQELLKKTQSPGKKLDFYTQELHREVNTIGSKSPLPELTEVVVEAKALIEQLKEQVQNIS